MAEMEILISCGLLGSQVAGYHVLKDHATSIFRVKMEAAWSSEMLLILHHHTASQSKRTFIDLLLP
jgi:succinylglutamate desuccinylase